MMIMLKGKKRKIRAWEGRGEEMLKMLERKHD
jgi:hypothetical protein